ncbi:MAG: hypothetical protein EBY41_00030 [Proteobacteria bacterium]|nr:hypothetical protein [Pseudomonadota bacterium]
MAVPASRTEFKEFCLRKLGKPVIEINVDDDQVDDRVDEALKFYWDYHYDGAERFYYKVELTNTDISNRYITVPENIIGVVRVFPIGDPAIRGGDLFNINYQIALNDLYTLTSVSMVPYYTARSNIALIQEMLVGQQPLRYNRHKDIVYIDTEWENYQAGDFLMLEAYQVIDPDTYTDTWSDWWLQKYATALIKRQWGNNLKKFEGMQLPGGLQFNGQQIYNEADEEIRQIEQEMIFNFSLPVTDMIG